MKKIMIRKFSTAQRITADKSEIKDFPKLPSATSFIRKRYLPLRLKKGGKKDEYLENTF